MESERIQEEESLKLFPYFFLSLAALLISSVFAFQTLCVNWGGSQLSTCTGIPALYIRDQQIVHAGIFPYFSYPFEYPLASGAVMLAINLASNGSLVAGLFLSSISMGLFAIGSFALFFLLGVDWKRVAVFCLAAPLMWQYGLSFEYEQMFLFLLSLYFFKRRSRVRSGFLLGLSSLVKYVPLVTVPFFLGSAGDTKQKASFVAPCISTFGLGIAVQYLLGPLNFLRALSYLSSYGVEGSWLGLLFGHVINYSSPKSWQIGETTILSAPKDYQIAGAVLILASLALIARSSKGSLELRCFYAFSSVYLFFWIAAPQNLINVALLLPLVREVRLKISLVAPYLLASFFSFELLLLYFFKYGSQTSLYLNIAAQGFFAIMLLFLFADKVEDSFNVRAK